LVASFRKIYFVVASFFGGIGGVAAITKYAICNEQYAN